MTDNGSSGRPAAYIAHFTPGRVRLRIPTRRRDPAFFAEVKTAVEAWPGIQEVRTNPRTASVLVFFSDPATTLAHAQNCDLFEIHEPEPTASNGSAVPIAERAQETARGLSGWLQQITGGRTDLRSLLLLALVGAAGYEMYRGNIRAPATSLLWYATEMLGARSGGLDRHSTASSHSA
jgi:hypothetical protein